MRPIVKTTLPFGPWLPDRAPLESKGLVTARNVLPVSESYAPARDISVGSSNALDFHCRGLFGTIDYAQSTPVVYGFAGDKAKLYRLSGASFSDVSKAGLPGGGYGLAADNRWEFARYDRGGLVVAAAINYAPQKWSLGTSTAFEDLGGTSAAGSGGTQLKFRHLCAWGGYLIGGYTQEDVVYPNKVKWSALNDPEDWAIDPEGTGSDEQILSDANGDIRKVIAGEQAWFILCEKSIHRADLIGGRYVFQFNRLTDRVGAAASGSVIQVGGVIYFLDRSGFYACDDSRVESIGDGKVDNYFLTQSANLGYLSRMSVAHDPEQKLIFWLYVSRDNPNIDPYPDRMLVYNYAEGRFTEIRQSVELEADFIGDFLTQPVSIDDLDDIFGSLEEVTPDNVDAPDFGGGFHQVALVSYNVSGTPHMLLYQTGGPLSVLIETPEVALVPGEKSMIRLARPLIDGGGSYVAVGARSRQQDSAAFGASKQEQAQGHVPLAGASSVGRFHRFQISTNAGTDFTKALGLEVEAVPMGRY